MIAAMTCGLDCAILDPLDRKPMAFIYATEALLGKDDFCVNYLTKYRGRPHRPAMMKAFGMPRI